MATSKGQPADDATARVAGKRRARLSQENVPSYSLEQALRVPEAIADSYASKPTRPLNVAHALEMSPGSSGFRMITGAAVAYGLTNGAAKAPEIGITPLGMRIVRPTVEGDDVAAKRQAFLRPKVIGEFLRKYDGESLPTDAIARNVLQEQGVPADRTAEVLKLITEGADAVGFVKEMKGKRYVDLAGSTAAVDGDRDVAKQPVTSQMTETLTPARPVPPTVSIGSGIHVNIEIHIAADASSDTIEDIFRNMRRYVLSEDGHVDGTTHSE